LLFLSSACMLLDESIMVLPIIRIGVSYKITANEQGLAAVAVFRVPSARTKAG
jgi:hypothetical protein